MLHDSLKFFRGIALLTLGIVLFILFVAWDFDWFAFRFILGMAIVILVIQLLLSKVDEFD